MARKSMPADGGGRRKGAPDGVAGEHVSGRSPAGESGGGAYHNAHSGQTDALPHGSQTQTRHYSGPGAAGADKGASSNAPNTAPDAVPEKPLPPPVADRPVRVVAADGGSFAVVEQSGVAAAEASGAVPAKPSEE
jgi:hypothetical protein